MESMRASILRWSVLRTSTGRQIRLWHRCCPSTANPGSVRTIATDGRLMSADAAASPPKKDGEAFFSTFSVTDQVFLRTPHALGIVNLKPIVPCHVLIIPPDPEIRRLRDLPADKIGPFFEAVQLVASRLEKALGCTSSNIAIQDGAEAGQTVPHLHVHILPRKKGDYARNDDIYGHLEAFGWSQKQLYEGQDDNGQLAQASPDADEDRRARSSEEMRREAAWLRSLLSEGASP